MAKVKTKFNGNDVEFEGTPDECAKFLKDLHKYELKFDLDDFVVEPINIPSFIGYNRPRYCNDRCIYPNIWHGTNPPPCVKCGNPNPNMQATWTTETCIIEDDNESFMETVSTPSSTMIDYRDYLDQRDCTEYSCAKPTNGCNCV